ncbi:hypothetical protein L7F22_067600 [Adiantum nelumboides]|nr:hypothetical protein [Adiantum nelumboides]
MVGRPELHAEDFDATHYVEGMVKRLMPRFEFKGEAAKFTGQVGKQPAHSLCKCCGKDESRKTLICDVCESSFHLKCLKLRTSNILLLDRWLCAACCAAEGGRPLLSTSYKRSALRSSSRSQRHMNTASQEAEKETGKIRFVLKLKTAHFKGSRARANEVVEVPSDQSTDESSERCARRPMCQMDCVSYTPHSELASLPAISCQEIGKELIGYDRARNKRAKVDNCVLASPRDTGKSHGVELLSSDDLHQTASNLYLCGDPSPELGLAEANEIRNEEGKSVNDLCSEQNLEVSPLNSQIKCLSLALVPKQVDSGLRLLGTVTEEVSELREDEKNGIEDMPSKENEGKFFKPAIEQSSHSVYTEEHAKQGEDACMNVTVCENDMKGIECSSATNLINKVDTPEQAIEHLPNNRKTGADANVRPKLSVSVFTHERVEINAQENRYLVKVVHDIQEGPWYKDAIELMGLEPLVCKGKHSVDDREAMLSSEQHSRLHVKLNTWCLLQVYADCRERCIIVYDLGKTKRDDAKVSLKTVDVERTWTLGEGFYVLLLTTKEAANESVCRCIISFQRGIGYAIPYVPSFSPFQEFQDTCPVWVTFVHLPVYFYPFLQELAMPLGKLLYVPCYEARESSDSPRVCVCWKVSKSIPEFLHVDMDGLGSKKLKIEFDLSLLRNLSKFSSQANTSAPSG